MGPLKRFADVCFWHKAFLQEYPWYGKQHALYVASCFRARHRIHVLEELLDPSTFENQLTHALWMRLDTAITAYNEIRNAPSREPISLLFLHSSNYFPYSQIGTLLSFQIFSLSSMEIKGWGNIFFKISY